MDLSLVIIWMNGYVSGYHLDESISILRVSGGCFYFICILHINLF